MVTMKINQATLAPDKLNDSQRKGDWISTFSGVQWYPIDPKPEDVVIEDIAHALSMLCRYNGHCEYFYSVAEHCWHLSYAVPKPYQLEALLHDAAEAYTSDIPRPLKHSPELKKFRGIEELNAKAIFTAFGLNFHESEVVKEYDKQIIKNEGEALLPNSTWYDSLDGIPNLTIMGYTPPTMKQLYLKRFYELKNEN